MSAISQIEKEIIEAVVFLRKNNQTIPSETIQFMKDASIEKLKKETSIINIQDFTKCECGSLVSLDDAVHDDDGNASCKDCQLGYAKELIIELKKELETKN